MMSQSKGPGFSGQKFDQLNEIEQISNNENSDENQSQHKLYDVTESDHDSEPMIEEL